MDATPQELRRTGERLVTLERLINLREGMTRADDTLPRRYFDDPMPLSLLSSRTIPLRPAPRRVLSRRGRDATGVPPPSAVETLNALIRPVWPRRAATGEVA